MNADSPLTEQEIDDLVTAQADDPDAWDPPVTVNPLEATELPLSADLARRAAFLARLHHESDAATWLARIIRERIELEEAAFAAVKRELGKTG